MAVIMGAIADDFTGATDLAGLIARSGHRVALRIGVPDEPPAATAPFEVIALKSRTAPVDEAVGDARRALAWLRQAGAERFFWKYCSTFDSTAEGNIGPVAEALMADLDATQTIYCPAFPENGRTIFMGNLFVGDESLAESPMKDHPLTPMRDSNLMRLLGAQTTRPVGLANRLTVAAGAEALSARLGALAAEGVGHVIVDAVADGDLTTIAAACRHMPLITGGSALAMPLPALWQADGLLPAPDPADRPVAPRAGAIVLSGSCSAMTNRQVAAFSPTNPAFKLDPLHLAENGPAVALDWLAEQPADAAPILYATAEPALVRAAQARLGIGAAGEIVEQALGEIAVRARDLGRRQIVVAGGESSGAVTRALGITRLEIGPEIAPGVPWCFAESDGARVAIALKSGNFGAETFFADALARLSA
ncbi:MAG: 3-oxo-tetronate kinase [Pseudomonadota bacterium]